MPKLISQSGQIRELGNRSVIGRDAQQCNIVLVEEFVSRVQATIEVKEFGHAELRNLSSRQSTFVNGRRVDVHFLNDGDLIEFGHGERVGFTFGADLSRQFPSAAIPHTQTQPPPTVFYKSPNPFNQQPNTNITPKAQHVPQQGGFPPPQVQHVVHHVSTVENPEGTLPTIALVGGILCACLMLVGLVPCLGWLNYFVLILSGVTKILCWVTIFTVNNRGGRNKAIIGLLLVFFAVFIGLVRLILGGGCA